MAIDNTSIKFDARSSVFKINDGSQLQDVSAHIADVQFGNRFKTTDLTTYGSVGSKPDLGLDDTEVTIDFVWNQYATTGVQTVVGAMYYAKATRAFEYYPAGTTAGNLKLSGSFKCVEYPMSGPVEGAVRVRARFLVHNGVTFGSAS